MIVRLYNFSKRKNSTARPSGSGTEYDMVLKENTSVVNPVLVHRKASDSNIAVWDYAYIPDFERYYFITDIVSTSNRNTEYHLQSDVLASFRSAIGASSQFIERCADHTNTNLFDPYTLAHCSQLATVHEVSAAAFDSSIFSPTSGAYILNVVGGNNSNASRLGITSYICSRTQIKSILDFLFDDNNFKNVITDEAIKSVFNPFQYISSILWLPINSGLGGSSRQVRFGWWNTKVSAKVLNSESYIVDTTITLPQPAYSDWRKYSPSWTSYKMYVPTCGYIDIDPAQVTTGKITVGLTIDTATGITMARLKNGSLGGDTIAIMTGMCGVPVQISQNSVNYMGVASQALGAVGQITSGNIIGGIGSLIDTTQEVLQPTPSSKGTAGSRASILAASQVSCLVSQKATHPVPRSRLGDIYYQIDTISNHSGYIKCVQASVSCEAFGSEKDTIHNYMNGGFYYE